jgi:hypothetical protein
MDLYINQLVFKGKTLFWKNLKRILVDTFNNFWTLLVWFCTLHRAKKYFFLNAKEKMLTLLDFLPSIKNLLQAYEFLHAFNKIN